MLPSSHLLNFTLLYFYTLFRGRNVLTPKVPPLPPIVSVVCQACCEQRTSGVMFYSQSTPESWAQHSHDNIVRAEHERMASVELRTLIDNVLNDTSRDMKEQADAVDAAFQKRVVEVDNAKMALEDNLRKVSIGLLRNTYAYNCCLCTGLCSLQKSLY